MLKFKTVTREMECKSLWEEFSPKQVLWDLWDVRRCFHTKNFRFNFILGFDEEKEGIIPLVYDKESNIYTYFGDDFPEQNRFFLKDKKELNNFLDNCPKGTRIYYIDSEEGEYYNFALDDKRYFLNLKKYENSFENYIASFAKKHRKNLNYDLRKLREKGYAIIKNDIKDFENLIDFNKVRFGEESNYNDEDFVMSIKNLMKIADNKGILDMISIQFGNKTEAVGLGIFYNKVYYVLASGRNVNIKNLGKLLIAEQIKSAIGLECNEVDLLSTEARWKELWNLNSEQMYEFIK